MKWVWWGVIGLSVFALLGAWWAWEGVCIEGDGFSDCRLSPSLGWTTAGAITVCAVGAIIVAITKLIRMRHPERLPTWTAH